jgi:glutamyl/glutaminyl-tRNA synthetase
LEDLDFLFYSCFDERMQKRIVSRMAPTPNGELHWGNFMNFALTWAAVKKQQGKLWLRLDDIDQDRCQERFAEDARFILGHVGLLWDEEFSGQIHHLEEYRHYLKSIPHYVCACSRQDIHQRTQDYHYDGHCRRLNLHYHPGANAIRFLSPKGPAHDFVLWRREDLPSYHLTSLADEERLGINLIVRGEDLLESTQVQLELSKTLAHDPLAKIHYIHHPLLLAHDGQKLSKSRQDGELLGLIKQGATAQDLWKELGSKMGMSLTKAEDLFTYLK